MNNEKFVTVKTDQWFLTERSHKQCYAMQTKTYARALFAIWTQQKKNGTKFYYFYSYKTAPQFSSFAEAKRKRFFLFCRSVGKNLIIIFAFIFTAHTHTKKEFSIQLICG